MNKKVLFLSVGMVAAITLTGCKGGGDKNSSTGPNSSTGGQVGRLYDNEKDPLIFSSQEVDGVFNPFFSTNANDSNVVGMTQLGMISNDKDGNPVVGEDEPTVVLDYSTETRAATAADGATESTVTVYNFVLKNNVKFSNGSPLTMKDVLFNLYVYLDPVYTGSSTIYSTDIVGLKQYRTQAESEKEQDSFKKQFQIEAERRIQNIIDLATEIFDEKSDESLTKETFRKYLAEKAKANTSYADVPTDYDQALVFFQEELESDYTNSVGGYDDITFTINDKVEKPFTTDVEVFLYNEGFISFNKKDQKIETLLANDYKELKTWTKEQAISTVYESKIPYSIEEVLMYFNTGVQLSDHIANDAMEKYFDDQKGQGSGLKYKNISGITFANKDTTVQVNGKSYLKPTYNADGGVASGNEVLSIKINGVDPKAIWNFSFGVAPMYYYSDADHIAKFDYVSNFGVEYSSPTFMNKVVKDPSKIGVPVGAGAYMASKASGGTDNISAGDFRDKGVIYFERNDNFLMGKPLIKKVRYQVVSQNRMLDALYNNEIDFVEPQAKPETITELDGKKKDGIGNKSVQTAGYGYIGINAGKIPDVNVRRAIMHAIDIKECVNYYKNTAKAIYRPMSLSSWAYPETAKLYYDYDNTGVTSENLVKAAGYTKGADGIYQKNGQKLQYTFTIAGEETDHPAWQALYHASEILNKIGFQVNVTTDSNALKKLSSGALTVWAAAWGSTIDPDMYQVYHKDSNATSVLNWGYKQILANKGGAYDYELATVEELSEWIEKGRETIDQSKRKGIYAQALDLVMDLAVELPTYQRDDLFAYNANKIDASTLTADDQLSSFNGLTSRIWELSLKTH